MGLSSRLGIIVLLTTMNVGAADKWATVWAGSAHGPYPFGSPVAQPELQFAFPGARSHDQTFRLILKPDLWSRSVRLRFSNVMGEHALRLDDLYVGVHAAAGRLLPGTNRPVRFAGASAITIEPGQLVWSDPVALNYVENPSLYSARKMAVSFHVAGDSGPMTWHAKAMQTSYLSSPQAGSHGAEETSDAFPFTSTSWYFLDAVDAMVPADVSVIAAFGDSITDGTNSTINGDDRWPDFLSARVHAAWGSKAVVINAGIGGNQVVGPAQYNAGQPANGGPSALERLERDVLSLAGVKTVIWLEGINDLGSSQATAEAVIAGFEKGIARLHTKNIRVVGATITSGLHSTVTHGTTEVDNRRKQINEWIRHSGAFDAVADFDAATLDPVSGTLRPEFQPGSSIGGPGDRLHPNRAGYQAMANSIPLPELLPRYKN